MNTNDDELDLFENTVMRFYGVDNNRFKLEDFVFEAIEDANDGYRSYLGSIKINAEEQKDRLIFFNTPLAYVHVQYVQNYRVDGFICFDGYLFIDNDDQHCWLAVGTDNVDDYYPCFTVRYDPKKVKRKK